MKQQLTEARKQEILYSLNYIWLLSECIKTEYMMYLHDTRFKNPLINNFSKRINRDAAEIQRLLKVTIPDEEYAEERMIELHRTLKFFADKNTEELREFNNKVEEETLSLQS